MGRLAPLLRALGHRVHEHPDVDWIEVGVFSLMAMPSTTAPAADADAVEALLWRSGRVAASFVSADGRGVASSAWWLRDPEYGPRSVQRQFRQNLRRGADRTVVRPVSWGEFRRAGLAVHRDAAIARGTVEARLPGPGAWEAICAAVENTPGVEATGCFVDRELAGFIVSATTAGVCEGILAEVSPRHADARPAHALYHGFAAEMIRRPGTTGVTVGRQSIPPRPSLDAFKRHAGFVAEPIRVVVTLHPRWRWLAAAPVRRGLHLARWGLGQHLPTLDNVVLLDAAAGGGIPAGRGETASE